MFEDWKGKRGGNVEYFCLKIWDIWERVGRKQKKKWNWILDSRKLCHAICELLFGVGYMQSSCIQPNQTTSSPPVIISMISSVYYYGTIFNVLTHWDRRTVVDITSHQAIITPASTPYAFGLVGTDTQHPNNTFPVIIIIKS